MKKIMLLLAGICAMNMNGQCMTSFDIGKNHTVAVMTNGALYAVGYNGFGQIGDGTNIQRYNLSQIGTQYNWAKVSGGGNHTAAIKTDGTLWTWGRNVQGELGQGNNNNALSPVQIGTEANWLNVYGGGFNTFAQKQDGTLWATGHNYYGQLGINSTSGSNVFVQVNADTDWAHVSAGPNHTVALKQNGTLWVWGATYYGPGTNYNNKIPNQLGTDTWISAAAGANHTIAVKSDGTLWTWGQNNKGQLGDGTTMWHIPTQIGTDTNWLEVGGGYEHSVAVKTDGTLWAWGEGSWVGGQTMVDQLAPLQIGTDTDWIHVIVDENHSKAQKANGSVWAWGDNIWYQLGTPLTGGLGPKMVICPTLATEDDALQAVSFYPNPATEFIYFQNPDNESQEISISDLSGKIVIKEKSLDGQVNVSALSAGVYLVNLNTSAGQRRLKFIKQ